MGDDYSLVNLIGLLFVLLLSLAWVMASAVHGAGDEMDIHYGRITAAAEVDVCAA